MHFRPIGMILLGCLLTSVARADEREPGFVPLFDGKTLDGWKVRRRFGT